MRTAQQNKSSKIIFGSDGIRGIVGEWPFTQEGMAQIALILAKFIQKQSKEPPLVFIGRDTRPSGKKFANQLKARLSRYGIPVWDLGIAPTPVIAYSVKRYSASLGIIVSASHNPIQYNGIKLVNSNGLRCQLDPGDPFEEMIEKAELTPCDLSKRTNASPVTPFVQNYIKDHIKILGSTNLEGLKIVVDCSNGAVAVTAPILLRRLGASVIALNINRSSKRRINENCGSEHVRKNPAGLIKLVRRKKYDYGIAFDGDGDRIVVVDKKGNFYNGDDLLYVLAKQLLTEKHLSKRTVVINGNANSGLKESFRAKGIKVVISKNGDKNLEGIMWRNGYLLGAEPVGNVIINDGCHGAADSLYAIALIFKKLNMKKRKTTLSEQTDSFRKYPQVLLSMRLTKRLLTHKLRKFRNMLMDNMEDSKLKRVIVWPSSTEDGLLNVMMEGSETESLVDPQKKAHFICQSILQLNNIQYEYIDTTDLSTRKRL